MTVTTLSQLFEFCTTKYNKRNLLIYRGKDDKFHNISTNELRDRVSYFALGLRELGVKAETKLLIISENRPEWHIADFAMSLLGAVTVPVFPTLIPGQIEYIINNSQTEFILVSNTEQREKIFQIREKIPNVKRVVVMDEEGARDEDIAFDQVIKTGREKDAVTFYESALETASPDSLATIIYTSGTTGVPKGVMLTHKNFVSNLLDCAAVISLSTIDRSLSFLPLSHAFERTVDYIYFYRGLSIIYSSSLENLSRDIKESAPTIMANVPRFYQKMKATIEARADEAGGLKKALFYWAVAVGGKVAETELNARPVGAFLKVRHSLARRLVLRKIQAAVGGNIRFFISGGAPLSAEVARFFSAAGLRILEGYGLTETAPVLSINPFEKPKFGTVGKVLPSVEIRIAEDGEILAKGPNIMQGYYLLEEETAEVLKDDWFHTGDIGTVDVDGYLTITDRKKQIMVTSVGKKIAPQAIEKAVENSKYIEQIVLVGEQRRFVAALIVPDFEQLGLFARKAGLKNVSAAELVKEESVVELIRLEIEKQQAIFSDYERIRKFELLAEPFTIENGKLTPTMKVKRKVVLQEYADLIDSIYAG